jgi:biopolymer transport protein ExbD
VVADRKSKGEWCPMKKTNMIEIMFYIVLIIFGIIALLFLQPKEIEFDIPRQFEINEQEGGNYGDTLFNE